MATKAELEAQEKAAAEAEAKAKAEAEAKAAEKKTLTNNTKGLRHVAGVKVLPGKSVELTADQLKAVQGNKVAMAWVEKGELSLK